MKLFSFKEDWFEILLLVLTFGPTVLMLGHWIAWITLALGTIVLVRLALTFGARMQLKRDVLFVTKHGLIVIGKSIRPDVVESTVTDTFEWLVEHHLFTNVDLETVLNGCVLEVMHESEWTGDWCGRSCPRLLLPWNDFAWFRCVLNDKKHVPALPHEIVHRLLFLNNKIEKTEDAHLAIEDIGFDLAG